MDSGKAMRGWGGCSECGYEGLLEYRTLAGEEYGDPQALAVVLLLSCPACGAREHTLVAADYYEELRREGG